MKRPLQLTVFIGVLVLALVLQYPAASFANGTGGSHIEVTAIEEGGHVVEGSPTVTAVPDPGRDVAEIIFSAKAVNEPEELYYPYAPLVNEPYSWTWPTGEPWVPDGDYILKMDITYATGEVETITRKVTVKNYEEPNAPDSPKNLLVEKRTDSALTLAWPPSETDKLFRYEVYKNGKKVADTTELTYTATGLAPGSLYEMRVKARDIYDNLSLDDNTVMVKSHAGNEKEDPNSLPFISEIEAPEPNGVNPRRGGYSGIITVSVTAKDPSVDRVDFYVKTYDSPEESYWKFPTTQVDGNVFSVSWDTTSAPEGKAIIKAVARDEEGQFTTVSRIFLVDNVLADYIPPTWEAADTPPAAYLIGYFAGWATYGDYKILRDLDASRLTHINYAFAVIDDDLRIAPSDPVQDPLNFVELAELKQQYPHLKTLIAIGGWGGSANFSAAASDEAAREIFADSIIDFIVEHGFDGVDIDWEYPVTGGGPGTYPNPADKENFPLLLKAIRQKLAEQQQIDGKYYTLSIAGAANPSFINNSQIGWAHKYLDFVQVMTYDIHGTWENLADFTAPLYDDEGKTWSVAQAVEAYLAAGVPKEKLVMGVPFYGYRYNVASAKDKGLRQPFTNAEAVTYNAIVKNDLLGTGYERYWDEGTKVPYLFNAEKLIFISHDDEESITLKAEYIKEQDLAGAMIWELSQDHGIDLLDSLYQVLKD